MSAEADAVEKTILLNRMRKIDSRSGANVDSKIHSPRFDCCAFLFYSLSAATFSTASARSRHDDACLAGGYFLLVNGVNWEASAAEYGAALLEQHGAPRPGPAG